MVKDINKDFYICLPGYVCGLLDTYIRKYGEEEWFEEAWEKYRQHIKTSSMDDMRMPGYVFIDYIRGEKNND